MSVPKHDNKKIEPSNIVYSQQYLSEVLKKGAMSQAGAHF